MARRGVVNTGMIVSPRLVIDFDDEIVLLDKNAVPLTLLLTQKIKSKTVANPEFGEMEDDFVPFQTTVTADASAGATTLSVEDSTIFRINDVVQVPSVSTEENMLVTAIDDSAGTITVMRGIGLAPSATPPAIGNGSIIIRVGNAFPEGSKSRQILTTQEKQFLNYCQIFKHTFGVTETLKNTKPNKGPKELDWQRKKGGIEFALEREYAMWFGKKYKFINSDGKIVRMMGGVLSFLTKNRADMGGVWSRYDFNDWLEEVAKYGSEVKYIFTSGTLIKRLSDEAENRVQIRQNEKTLGIAIAEYITPTGKKFYLINNSRVFDKEPYSNMAVALDLANVRRVKFRGVVLKTNIQENDADEEKDQFISEESIEVKLAETHGVMENIG